MVPFLKATDYWSENSIYLRIDTIIGFEMVWNEKERIPCIRTHNDTIRVKELPSDLIITFDAHIKKLREEAEKNAPANPFEAMLGSLGQGGY